MERICCNLLIIWSVSGHLQTSQEESTNEKVESIDKIDGAVWKEKSLPTNPTIGSVTVHLQTSQEESTNEKVQSIDKIDGAV